MQSVVRIGFHVRFMHCQDLALQAFGCSCQCSSSSVLLSCAVLRFGIARLSSAVLPETFVQRPIRESSVIL